MPSASTAPGQHGFGHAHRVGVAAICEMKVVMCNYPHLYTGTFSWQTDLNGPYGQNRKSVTVNVVNGIATCDGSETRELEPFAVS